MLFISKINTNKFKDLLNYPKIMSIFTQSNMNKQLISQWHVHQTPPSPNFFSLESKLDRSSQTVRQICRFIKYVFLYSDSTPEAISQYKYII